ncbi:protein FAM199X-like isoform X2 [Mytilus galloprovincialis]|uniref:protein FAM199X-like isoform X2 n=1 Tax=Mytilus galloprovincialis TaxID=29158 RepID=UPI003F7B725E
MFTDNVVAMPSPWCLDNILLKDVSPESWKYSPERNTNDTEYYIFEEAGIDRVRQFNDYCNLSTGTSVASSECSDDLYLDVDADTEADLFGDLASSVLSIIQDIKDTDFSEVVLEDITDTDLDSSCDNCDRVIPPAEPASIDLSCSSCSNYSSKNRKHKKWNDLNEHEKVIVVDQLSQRISRDLGIREQLEVLRIIDPKSRISPTDKQFLIDITNMTEEKIEKIQDYIKTHSCSDCQSDDNGVSTPSPRKSKKRQMSQERKNQQRADRQRQRKDYRQILKEKRSGLFVKEEVLSMSRLTPPPEEEDIDIIG